MRTFSMMLGEMDYINTFVNPYHCTKQAAKDEANPPLTTLPPSASAPTSAGHTTDQSWDRRSRLNCSNDLRRLPHPFASFGILGIFMVFMPILLMNLLIGLAVGDIESVRRNAQLKRLAMQVWAKCLKLGVSYECLRVGCGAGRIRILNDQTSDCVLKDERAVLVVE